MLEAFFTPFACKWRSELAAASCLLEICESYFSDEEYDKAFALLLDNYYKNKDIVKKKLLEFFEALGNDHDATKTYRKKLSSLLFK